MRTHYASLRSTSFKPAPVLALALALGAVPLVVANAPAAAVLVLAALVLARPTLPPAPPVLALGVLAALALQPSSYPSGFNLFWLTLAALVLAALSTHDRQRITDAITLAALVHAAAALVWVHNGRAYGLLGNPNILGGFITPALVLALSERRYAACFVLAFTLCISGSIGGAIMGFLAGFLALLFHWTPPRRRRALLAVAVAAVTLSLLLIAAIAPARPWWSMRLDQWQTAAAMFAASPITGTGPGSFADYWQQDHERPHQHAHSLYLNVAGERGIAGLVLLAIVGAWALRQASPGPRAALVAIAAHGLVDTTTKHAIILLLVAALVAIDSKSADSASTRPARLTVTAATVALALAALAGTLGAGIAALYLS